MKIAGLQKVSLIDYPGRIAASVFIGGCNLDCWYCHNRWMIDEAQVPEAITRGELLEWLRTRLGLLGGVCVSGGEPLDHEETPNLLREIKALGFGVKVDTNGTRPAMLERILVEGLVDYVAMDIKAPLDSRYARLAGRKVDIEALHESMVLLRSSVTEFEFRTTVAPPLDERDLEEIGREIRPGEQWYLQAYSPGPERRMPYDDAEEYDSTQLAEMAVRLRARVPGISVRGG